mgnify:CR=1 FL=1
MQGEKAAFRPCAYAEGALTHHGQTLVPGADRRHLRLEGGGRCTVEPADYSYRQVQAATLELPGSGPEGKMRRHLRRKGKRVCSKRPKTQGKVEISHSLKDRPKQADVGSHLGDWVDDTLIEVGPVCLLALANRASRLLVARRCHHDSADVLKLGLELCWAVPSRQSPLSGASSSQGM